MANRIGFRGIPSKYNDYLRPIVQNILHMGCYDKASLLFDAPERVEVRLATRLGEGWWEHTFHFNKTDEEVWAIKPYLFSGSGRCWLVARLLKTTLVKKVEFSA